MTKEEREIFQRNLMVAIKLIAEAYALNEPIQNIVRAQESLNDSLNIVMGKDGK